MSKIALTAAAGLAIAAGVSARPIYTNSTPVAIPDNTPAGINSVINVADSFTVTGVSMTYTGLNHTWAGDLIFTLSHGAQSLVFLDRPGSAPGSGAVGLNADFLAANSYGWADGGTAFPETGITIVNSGTYAPGQGVGGVGATFASAFGGFGSAGAWTLNVSDNAGLDLGGWSSWSLNLVPTPGATALLGLAGLAGLRRRR